MDTKISSEPALEIESSSNADAGAFTIEVFGIDGIHRASGVVLSFPDAMEWLDATPVTLDPQEPLMIRVEGPDQFGCWMYFSPSDAPEDWPMSEAAHQVRFLTKSRHRVVAP